MWGTVERALDHQAGGPSQGIIPVPEPEGPVESMGSPQDESDARVAGSGESGSLDTLDDELARLADEMVTGDFHSEATSEAISAGAPVMESSPPTEHPVSAPQTAAPSPTPSPSSPVAQQSDTQPEPTDGRVSVFWRAAAAISRPLEGKPDWVRKTVGAAAALQLVLAAGVWGHMLFIRSPEAPTPTIAEVDLRERHAPAKPVTKSADHGKAKSHGSSKSSDHGKAKTSDHGKSSHGAKPAKGGH